MYAYISKRSRTLLGWGGEALLQGGIRKRSIPEDGGHLRLQPHPGGRPSLNYPGTADSAGVGMEGRWAERSWSSQSSLSPLTCPGLVASETGHQASRGGVSEDPECFMPPLLGPFSMQRLSEDMTHYLS